IDKRARFLMKRLEDALVIDPQTLTSKTIVFGATVTIIDDDDNEQTYQIVGEDEFDIKAWKISWKSPVATALLGKKVGDEVTIRKPGGDVIVSIQSVEYI
ncbi:MAG: transcription elongation factor GreB, partial [Proteobacteria bacterium]